MEVTWAWATLISPEDNATTNSGVCKQSVADKGRSIHVSNNFAHLKKQTPRVYADVKAGSSTESLIWLL